MWYYGVHCVAQIIQITYTQGFRLRVSCPLQDILGDTVDISEYIDFNFYVHVSCKDKYVLGLTSIGRCLGDYHKVGIKMLY